MLSKIFFFFLFFPVSVFAANYEISGRFIKGDMSLRVCDLLEAIHKIQELEKKDNLTKEERQRIELFQDIIKDFNVNKSLSQWAAEVSLSVPLPARIVMNRDNFVIIGNEGEEIPVVDLTLSPKMEIRDEGDGIPVVDLVPVNMNKDGVIDFEGSEGRITLGVHLKLGAFCPYVTEENPTPSLEMILSGLIKE